MHTRAPIHTQLTRHTHNIHTHTHIYVRVYTLRHTPFKLLCTDHYPLGLRANTPTPTHSHTLYYSWLIIDLSETRIHTHTLRSYHSHAISRTHIHTFTTIHTHVTIHEHATTQRNTPACTDHFHTTLSQKRFTFTPFTSGHYRNVTELEQLAILLYFSFFLFGLLVSDGELSSERWQQLFLLTEGDVNKGHSNLTLGERKELLSVKESTVFRWELVFLL